VAVAAAEAEAGARARSCRRVAREARQSRALVGERDAFEDGETPVDEADPDARRRSVHEQARDRLEKLRNEEGS